MAFERPANPLVAVLERHARKRGREDDQKPEVSVTNVARPTPKRLRSKSSIIKPPFLTGVVRVTWEPQEPPELEMESPITHNKFQPIHWPGDAAVSSSLGQNQPQSRLPSLAAKSLASLDLSCRRNLDVSFTMNAHHRPRAFSRR